jgi:DNA-binding MarR family transcriptional regulator
MHLVLQVLATAKALEKAGQRIFKPHGLTVAQFNVLNLLSDPEEGMRASDLADALIVDRSNVTGLLKRMNSAGYLIELANPNDGRQRIVTLSAKGRRLWKQTHTEYQQALDAIESKLTVADRRAAAKVLADMVTSSAYLP